MNRKLIALIILAACDPNKTEAEQGAYDEGYAQGYQDAADTLNADYDALEARLAAVETNDALQDGRLDTTEASIDAMLPVVEDVDTLLTYVSVDELDALGPAVKVVGANLYVQSGSGLTYGEVNGTGNLIIGYSESADGESYGRSGSHNLILGGGNDWTSYSGIVASNRSEVTAPYAAVIGGQSNVVSGESAVIIGGQSNEIRNDEATGSYAVITAGSENTVTYPLAWIGAGTKNTASGYYSAVIGGNSNTVATASTALVGGSGTEYSGESTAVVGGRSLPMSVDGAAALAMCRAYDYASAVNNSTVDAQYVDDGSNGNTACESAGVDAYCAEVHYVYLRDSGYVESNVYACGEDVTYADPANVSAFACCVR